MSCLFALLATLAATAQTVSADPLKIRLDWVTTPGELAPILFAHPGIAVHEGSSYVLELIHFTGGPLSVTALASNEVDIGGFGYGTIGTAIENAGLSDLRVIGDVEQDGVPGWYSNGFIVLNDSPIRTVDDMKGKILAVNKIGSVQDIGGRAMLRKHGIDDRKDLTIIEAAYPNMKAVLAGRKADIVVVIPPFAQDPELRQIARVLFTMADAVGKTQVSALVARASFIAEHRGAVIDFLEDDIRATRWYLDPANHQEAVHIVADFLKQPPEVFAPWVFTHDDQFRDPDVLPDVSVLQANLNTLYRFGLLKSPLDIGSYVDLSLVKEAAARIR